MAEVSSRPGISVSGLISMHSFLNLGFLRQASSIQRHYETAANFGASVSSWEGGEKKRRGTDLGGLAVVPRNCSQHHEWFLKSLCFCSGDAPLSAGGRHTQASLPGTTLPSSQP